MERHLTKLLFFFVILFLLLGAGSYIYYWLSIIFFCILFSFYYKQLEWSVINFRRADVIVWSIFLIISLFSSFFSKSIPASFEEFTLYLFSCFLYFFIVMFPKKLLSQKDFLHITILATIVLSFVSLVNYYHSSISTISQTTLINYYYGHNHLASILILSLPIVYYYYFFNRNRIQKILFFFLFVSLLLTLGRVAIMVGILEFIFVHLIFKRTVSKRELISYFIVLVVPILLLLIVSFSHVFLKEICTSSYRFKVVLCKSLQNEGRIYYWQQAINGLKENYFIGTGPGTFFITNNKYQQLLNIKTAYAHNAYLQFFSEMGVLGGISFIGLILCLFFISLRATEKKSLSFMMFIGLLGMLFNVFFDFDLSISAVFIFTFLYFAILVREKNGYGSIKKSNSFFKIVMILFATFLLITSFLFFADIVILKQKDVQIKKEVFLFNSQKQSYFKKYTFDTLYPYFKNDSEFYMHFYNHGTLDTVQKISVFKKIRKLLPASIIYFHDYELYKSQSKLDEYRSELLEGLDLLQKFESATGVYYYDQRKELLSKLFLLYDPLEEDNFESTLELIHLTTNIYPWYHHKIDYNAIDLPSKSCDITKEIIDLSGEPFGEQRIPVAKIYLQCLAYCKLSFNSDGTDMCFLKDRIIHNYFEYTHEDPRQFLIDFTGVVGQSIYDDTQFSQTKLLEQAIFIEDTEREIKKEYQTELEHYFF